MNNQNYDNRTEPSSGQAQRGEYTWSGSSYSSGRYVPRQDSGSYGYEYQPQTGDAQQQSQYSSRFRSRSTETQSTQDDSSTVWRAEPCTGGRSTFAFGEKEKTYTFTKRTLAAALVIIVAFSALFGAGGGYLAYKLLNPDTASGTAIDQSSPAVMYQSVTGGASGGETGYAVANVAAAVADSVVEIRTEAVAYSSFMGEYVQDGAGSGVIITADGYVVTNNHVIEDASRITVTTRSGKSYDAQLIATDEKTDLAVLKVEAEGLTAAVFGDSSKLVVGEPAIAIGNPLGELGGTVTSGIISALAREVTIDGQPMSLLQTNASINPGNSGGGLFNAAGELIGIVNAKSTGSDVEGLGFAIPSDTAKTVIEQLISFGYVQGRVSLGMTLVEINDRYSASIYRVNEYGVYVLEVDEGSNAQTAGFSAGDLIVSVDGKEIDSTTTLNAVLDEYSVGDTVEIVVSRRNRQGTLTLTLEEYTK